jgi:hypothetical protein
MKDVLLNMPSYKWEFTKEVLEGTEEERYLETRSRWYLTREACIKHLGIDPEDYLKEA